MSKFFRPVNRIVQPVRFPLIVSAMGVNGVPAELQLEPCRKKSITRHEPLHQVHRSELLRHRGEFPYNVLAETIQLADDVRFEFPSTMQQATLRWVAHPTASR